MRTVRQAIAKLEEWYADDLDQPIFLYTHDRDELWHNKVEDSENAELQAKYPTAKDLPKELLEKVFSSLFEGDAIWEDINYSETWEWDKWHEEESKAKEMAKEDTELWDKE